ncbi:hypothetical protein D3C84_631940 [compost metagenome]
MPLPSTAGRNISAKPTSMAGAALAASGSCSSSSSGTIGADSQLKIGVYSAIARDRVPMAITSGSRPSQISTTLCTPTLTICAGDGLLLARLTACSTPQRSSELPLGTSSLICLPTPATYSSFFHDSGGMRGVMMAAARPATTTVR